MQPSKLIAVSTASAPPFGAALTHCFCGHSDCRGPCPVMTPPRGFRGLRRFPGPSEGTSKAASRSGFEQLRMFLPPEGAGALQTATRNAFPQKRSLRFFE